MNSWMYGSLRFKAGFREEVDKFIEAVEKHATTLTENKDTIIYPCKDYKNRMTWTDVTIIKSHLIMQGFVEDYTVWIHHGETVIVNDEDEEEYDDETIEFMSQYSTELDARIYFELSMNKVVMLVVEMVMTKVVPIMMVEHVSGMKMIWRT